MSYQIEKVLIYPKNKTFKHIEFDFFTNSLNVIHGTSKSGKSAFIGIINYCLCSSSCEIPLGIIRDAVEYYGLLLGIDDYHILVARKRPESQDKTSSEMYLEYGDKIVIPEEIQSNANLDYVLPKLNEIFGHSTKQLMPGQKNKGIHPTFRLGVDMSLQRQSMLTDNRSLFDIPSFDINAYRFSLIIQNSMGLIDEQEVVERAQMKELKAKLERIETAKNKREAEQSSLLSNLKSWFGKCLEYGLIKRECETENVDDLILILNNVLKKREELYKAKNQIPDAVDRTTQLSNERDEINGQLFLLRKKLTSISKLYSQKDDLNNTYNIQLQRIQISSWLKQLIAENENQALLGYSLSKDSISKLADATEQIEKEIANSKKFFLDLEKEKSECEEQIKQLSERLSLLDETLDEERFTFNRGENGFSIGDKLVFLGQLDSFLKYNSNQKQQDYDSEIESLSTQIDSLEKTLNSKEKMLTQKKKLFENLLGHYASKMGAEYAENGILFSFKDLNISVLKDNLYKPFSELGSGSNVSAYHIASELAILSYKNIYDKNNKMPGFAIIDQPSQCFFENDHKNQDFNQIKEGDRQLLNSFFETMKECVDNHSCQLIVIEHAGEEVWGQYAVAVKHFSKYDKLIPKEWEEAFAQ